jgi:acyl dehydratase
MRILKNMKNVTFDEIEVGASASFSHTLAQPGIELLALVSGDVDPFHIQPDGSPSDLTDSNTIDGAAAAALISIAIGTKLPGRWRKSKRAVESFWIAAVSTRTASNW